MLALVVASLATGEWLRSSGEIPAAVAVAASVAGAVLALAAGRRRPIPALVLVLAAVLIGTSQIKINRLRDHWIEEREARVVSASARLAEELRLGRVLAESLATRAAALSDLPPDEGFAAIGRLIPDRGLEAGVAVLEASGMPRIWAGRFRVRPEALGDSTGARLTTYYAVFEARRHADSDRVAVANVLLAAHEVVPDPERSLSARYESRTGVALRILPPRLAPDSSDVFDYEQPTTGGIRTLFSVQLVPAEQERALATERLTGGRRVAWTMLLSLAVGLAFAPAGIARALVLGAGLILTLRAPLGSLLGVEALFDPRIFSDPVLGPLSATAAALGLAGALATIFGVILWRRSFRRTWPGAVVALALILGAPYLLSELGRGLSPPPTGTSTDTWLTWQLALFMAAAGMLTVAAALVKGREPTKGHWRAPVAGAVLGLVAAAIGAWVWNARYGWPDWYPFIWIPALVLVIWPADRRAVIAGIAIAAGSASALVTWGAEVEDRMSAARRDIASLGDTPDPAGENMLRSFAERLEQEPTPRNAPELLALWRGAAFGAEGRPVMLAIFDADGTKRAGLELNRLDLSTDVLSAHVRTLPADSAERILSIPSVPAIHHLLLARRDSATVLAVVLGPRSSLVRATRLGRLLARSSGQRPPYRLTLAPAPSRNRPDPGLALWRREGWRVRGERVVEIGGVAKDVFGVVELGRPGGLAVRAALIVTLDAALLAALWTIAILLGGETPLRPTWLPRMRSYQARLGAALTVFFLAPAVGFATWGYRHLRTELRHGRDRVIEWTLRDAVPPSGALPANPQAAREELAEESSKVDADLALYRDGMLMAESSEEVLPALGLLTPFPDPEAYQRLLLRGEIVAAVDGPSHAVPLRVGYQPVLLSDLTPGILASPSVVGDPDLSERQRDLAYILVLATLAGIAASLLAARRAARALARPVSDLRHAAQAFGRGETSLPRDEPQPAEFKPVFAAFEKMTADVRAAQEAQERVARIVAWGEMASQVAHEIKNPLTPMRLGVQHLRRVHEDRNSPLGQVVDETTRRILAEIDRLDRIARSFSRFGVPASAGGPLEEVSLAEVAREVADLYRIGSDGAIIELEIEAADPVAARADEVKEALMNLVENARNARAQAVRLVVSGRSIAVIDDGTGIPPTLLPRVFEPRFSTTTSGSGLGLAIVKRLVESWGGVLTLTSELGKGTIVRLDLLPASRVASPASPPETSIPP